MKNQANTPTQPYGNNPGGAGVIGRAFACAAVCGLMLMGANSADAVDYMFYHDGTTGKLYKANLDGSSPTVILSYNGSISTAASDTVAIDPVNSAVYYIRVFNDVNRGLYKTDYSGSSPTRISPNAANAVSGLAIDYVNHKVYFHDDTAAMWYKADSDGSNAQGLLSMSGNGCYAAVDPAHGYLYYINPVNSASRGLYRTDLAISSPGTRISTSNNNIAGIAVDSANSKIYFSDVTAPAIYQADLDGANAVSKLVIASGSAPVHIALDPVNSRIYYYSPVNNTARGLYRTGANYDFSSSIRVSTSTDVTGQPGLTTMAVTAPSISGVTGPSAGAYTVGGHLDFTVSYDSSVDVSGSPYLPVTVGSSSVQAAYVSGSGTTSLVFRYTVQPADTDSDGVTSFSPLVLNGGTITKSSSATSANLTFTPPTTTSVLVDTTVPIVSIGSPSQSITASGPISYTVSYSDTALDTSSISLSAGQVTVNTTGTAAVGSVGVSGSGSSRTVTLGSITGDGTVGISISSGTASDLAGNLAGGAGPGGTAFVDNTAPTIVISGPSVSITNGSGSVSYTVTYADANFSSCTLVAGNITVNSTGTASAGSVAVTGSGLTRTLTLSSLSGNGTLGISIAAGTASDIAGNAAPAAGPSTTFTVDTIAPVTPGLTGISQDTGASSIDRVTSDTTLVINGTGEAGSTVIVSTNGTQIGTAVINGSGVWSFDYTGTVLPDGVYNLRVQSLDAAGNYSGIIAFGVTIDTVAPTVQSIVRRTPVTNENDSIELAYWVQFSEPMSIASYHTSDFVLTTTGDAVGTVSQILPYGFTNCEVRVRPVSGNGTIRLDLKASGVTATDFAGNPIAGGGFTTAEVYTVTQNSPYIVIDNTINLATNLAGNGSLISQTTNRAKVFTVPAGSPWTLDEITMALAITNGSAPFTLHGRLFLADSFNRPTGAELASFTATPAVSTAMQYFTFDKDALAALGNFALQPGVKYALTFGLDTPNALMWGSPSGNPAYVAARGFVYNTGDLSVNSGGTWSSSGTTHAMQIRASLWVAQPPVITSALTASGTYGQAFSYSITADTNNVTYVASGLPAGLTLDSSSGLISGMPLQVGTFNVTIGATNIGGLGTNNLALTVDKATLTVSNVLAIDKPYDGSAAASLNLVGAQLVEVVSPDSVSLDTTSASASFADKNAGNGKSVTVLGLGLTGANASNYTLTQPALSASISKIGLTVKANDQSRAYGDANPVFTFSYTGFAGLDDATSLTTLPTASTTATPTSWIGKYNIVPSGGSATNYTLSYANGQLTVTKTPLNITANDFSRGYGSPNPTFTAVITGVKNSDNITANLTTPATPLSAPGDYSINVGVNDPTGKLGAYTLTVKKGILSVTNAVLTGQVAAVSRGYGQANPAFSVSYTGFVNGQNSNVLSGALTFSCLDTNGTPVDATTPVGVYPVEVLNVQSNANYTISYVGSTLTVTQAVLSITASNATKVYGNANPAFSVSYAGFVNGEDTNVLGGGLAINTAASSSSDVGNYDIVPSGWTASNYSLVYSNGTLTVTPAALSVTVSNATKVYGQSVPSLGGSISGLVNGDTITATYLTAATASSATGSYPIVPSFSDPGSKLGNYAVATNGGTLSITSASLTGTVLSYSRAYGDTNPVFAISYSGFVNGDTAGIVTGTPLFGCVDLGSNPVGTNTPVGNYAITVSTPQTAPNYAISYQPGALSVTQAVLVITADNTGKVYGATNPALSATITGFVNGENTNALTGFLVLNTTATVNSGVGAYPITAGGFTSSNYQINYVDGVLTVGKAILTVTADNKTRDYGTSNPAFTAQYSGFVDGDNQGVVSGSPSLTTAAVQGSDVGNYAITAAAGSLSVSNYVFSFVDGTLTVAPVAMSVTADSASRAYGVSNPTFTGTIVGLTNSDNITATYSSTATAASTVGNYNITPTFSDPGSKLHNYVVTTNIGTLTVTQASLTVTANNKTKTYGQANPALDGSISGVANSDNITVSYSTTAGVSSPVGSYTITPTLNDPNGKLANYSLTSSTGTLSVTKALLTVTADDQRRTYGETNPVLTLSYSGFVGTDNPASLTVIPTASVNADTNSWIGTYPIVAAGGVANNYDFAYVDGTLTVGKPQLIVTVDNKTRYYGSTNPTLTATIIGLANNDNVGAFLVTAATTNSAPGSYDIDVGFDDPDGLLGLYDLSVTGGALTVAKAPLTGTIQSASRTYGTDNPAFSISYSGFVNGQSSNVLSGTLAFSCKTSLGANVTRATSVGSYAIRVAALQTSPNYDIQYVDGTLTVNRAALTVSANSGTRVYGATNPAFSGTITGIQNSDNITATYATAATVTSGVAGYAIVPTLVDPSSKLGNYDVTSNNGTLSVTPASLTGTVANATRVYGETNPVFQASYSGYVNGDTDSVLAGALGFSCQDTNAVDVTTNTTVGVYAIHVSTPQTAANYSLSYTDGVLTVTQAVLTVVAADQSRAYGQTNPDLTYTITGFANYEDTNVVSGAPGLSTGATVVSPIGSYDIIATAGSLSATNYSFVTSNATLHITHGALVVSADNTNRFYGLSNPAFTGTITGLQNGDSISATYATAATATNDIGTYAIVPTLVDPSNLASNYTVTLNNGTLTVNKATLGVAANSTSRLYGQTNPVFTGTISGVQNSDDITATYATTADATSLVGNYDIVPTLVDPANKLGNYDVSSTNGVLSVNQAPLTVTADNQSRMYGSANPTFTGTVTGVQNGDNITATYATAGDVTTGVGSYAIVPTLVDPNSKLGNYSVTVNNGSLSITSAPLSVIAGDATRLYGATNPTFNGVVSGVLNSDGITATYATVATPATGLGSYAIVPSWIDPNNKLGNYSASVTNGNLTINAAALTGTLWSFTRTYGDTNPVFGVTYSGYVNGENDSILTGSLALSCVDANTNAVDTNTMVGVYPITVVSAQGAPNYNVSYVNGSLTITQAVLLVSADNKSKVYGDANPVLTATITGFVNGENTNVVGGQADLSTTATVSSPVASYDIVAALGSLSATNYSFTFTNGTLTVGKAMLTVTADNKTRTYGATNPVLRATVTGFVDGDTASVLSGQPALSTLADTNSPIGNYTISTAAGDLAAGNYAFTYVDGTLSVTPVALTATADNQTRVYGATNPVFSISYTGFVNGQDSNALIALPTASTIADTNTSVGSYTIALSGGQSTNYTITLVDGTLSITQAALTATADNQARAYGVTNPVLSISYTGFVNGDDSSKLQVLPQASTLADVTSHVGTYTISINGGSDHNYAITLVNGTLSVTQAALTATADNQTRVYGSANPTLSITYTGFQNGDTASVLNSAPSISTTATPTSGVGTYPITLSGGSDNDYAITLVNGNLTVTAAPLSVIAGNATRLYGATNPLFSGVVSGVVNNDGISASYATAATPATGVGTYAIVPTWVDPNNKLGNYSASVTNGTLTINVAPLTGTLWSFTRTYGDTNPVFGVTYSGYVNGENDSILTGSLALSCVDANTNAVDTNTMVGVYPITVATAQTAPNYNVSYVNGSLTITQAVLLVSADNKSKVYGDTNPVLTATITGFVNAETTNVVGGQADLSTTATVSSPVASYDIVAALGTLSATNYSFTFTNGTLTIGKAMLTVTADNQTRTYGATNPGLTATVTGFVDGDTASVLSGQPALSTLADTNSPIGNYTISTAAGDLTATNYAFTYVDGLLSVTPAALTATADNQTRVYGATNPVLSISYSGFVNGQDSNALIALPTASTIADANTSVGSYTIALSGGQSTNYTITLVDGTLSITQASLTATADDQTRAYGVTNPVLSISYTGFVNGDDSSKLQVLPQASTLADVTSHVGTYTISLNGGSDHNYAITLVNGTLSVTQAALTATADNQTRVYGSANPTLSITYTGFQNGDTASVLNSAPSISTTASPTSDVGTYPITLSGGSDNDYAITLVNGNLTVTAAPLSVIAGNATRLYGATNPLFSGVVSGVVNNDGISASYATAATPATGVGNYAIVPSWVDPNNKLGNYSTSVTNGTLTINAAPLTGTLWSFTRTYGDTNPVFGVTYSGYVNGENDSILTGSLALSCVDANTNAVDTNTMVGVYPITVTSAQGAPNYNVSYVNGSLTITQAVLLVSADNKSKVYGDTNPVFTATITGFVNAEATNVVSGQADLSTTATVSSPVASYDIVAALGSLSATNYSFTFTNGTLTVGKAMLTVTADNQTRTYGATNPVLSATVTGFVDGDTASVLSGQPVLSTLADTNSPIGNYTISTAAGDLAAANYAFTYVDGLFSITPAALTATADNQTRVYGATNPVLSISYTGFVNGQDSSALLALPTASTIADTNTSVGSYTIALSGGQSTNYTITLVDGTLSITQAAITATADDQTRAYGVTNPVLSISYTGFVNGEDSSKLQVLPQASTLADVTSHVGTYTISLNGGSDHNYAITLVNGTLSVTQAALTATADNQTRVYGSANPTLTISYNGFKNTDDASVLNAAPAISTAATPTSGVGAYAITLSGGSDNDYAITLVDGTLTVTQANLTITAANASRPYGTVNPAFFGTIAGIKNSDPISATYASPAVTNSPAGTYAIAPTVVDPFNLISNYNVSLVNGTLTVTAAVDLTGTPGFFVVGDWSVNIDTAGQVADGGSLNFGGATLTVAIVTNASPEDMLAVEPGTGSPVSVDGTNVALNGVVFGSFSGGDGIHPLVVEFNTNATSVELTALIRELVFTTTDESTNARQVQLTLAYGDITVTASRSIILDRAPVANDDTFLVKQGDVLNITFASLLANDTDADNDHLSIEDVSRTTVAGGHITRTSTGLTYTPPATPVAQDSFAYSVKDGRGGNSIGLVTLICVKPFRLTIHMDNSQQAVIRMGGTPGVTYRVDVSDDLVNWSTLGTVTANTYGAIQALDADAKDKPQRFYRAVVE